MTTPRVLRWTETPAPELHITVWLDDPAYPPALLAARRAEFRARIQAHNSNSDRLDAIARALPTADNPDELIEEAAEILTHLGKE